MTRLRMPAEWAPHERTLMCRPARADMWGERFEQARADHATVANAVAAFEPVLMAVDPSQAREARAACAAEVDVVPSRSTTRGRATPVPSSSPGRGGGRAWTSGSTPGGEVPPLRRRRPLRRARARPPRRGADRRRGPRPGGRLDPGAETDEAVLARLAALYPGREAVAVPGTTLAHGGGGVHCITQQVPAVEAVRPALRPASS